MSSKKSTTAGFEPQSSDSKSDALSVGPCGHVSCRLYLFLVQLPNVVSISRKFPLCQAKSRPLRDSNPNLLIRSQTPYPLGLAAMYLLLVQLPSCVLFNDSISEKLPLCQAESRRQRDSNPQSSDSKSDALSVGPCGQVSCQLYVTCSVAKSCPLC